jgi:hypothetical protein
MHSAAGQSLRTADHPDEIPGHQPEALKVEVNPQDAFRHCK